MNIFDEEDKILFLVEDNDLKAKAIRNSILPRLVLIVNELISRIIEVYKIDFYSDSSIIKSPNFRIRDNRNKLKIDYTYASAGISGIRKINKWHAVKKKSNKEAIVLPFRFELLLDIHGIRIIFHNQYLKDFRSTIYRAYLEFLIENSDIVQSILQKAHCFQLTWFDNDENYIDSYKNSLIYSLQKNWNEIQIESDCIKYPIDEIDKEMLISSAINLFPLYNSFINISKGGADELNQFVALLKKWKWDTKDRFNFLNSISQATDSNLIDKAKELADTKIKIIPSIRWQVFQRDNWKCVSCGRSSDDGIILHVDHIIPRSKGGHDLINNFQTLCNICNIGKSNKDDTNIRDR